MGVRASESARRKGRKVFEGKNKTFVKKNKTTIDQYFEDRCQGVGAPNKISLKPIVDWTDSDVWSYIRKYNLPVNPLYNQGLNRVGCMICPKVNFTRNYVMLMRYPKLVDCVINARTRGGHGNNIDWVVCKGRLDEEDLSNDKVYYVCRWLNHSFMPFSKKQEKLYKNFREYYEKTKSVPERS